MFAQRYRSLVRIGALYDLLATVAFATPWTFAIAHGLLNRLSPLPAFEPLHVLFANLLGTIVVVWALVRLRDPRPGYGLCDALGRGLFAVWQLYYLLATDGAPVVWVFVFFEVLFGLAQGYGYWLLARSDSGSQPGCRLVRHLTRAA